jgi:hypothetical protein
MKLEASFNKFLVDVVNLNQSRVDVATTGIETMTKFLKNNELFGPLFIDTKPQGSIRQQTIIKPTDPEIDFDVDLLFEMKAVDGWQPKDYLENLADEFRKTGRYKDKIDTRGKTRCVTIDYESDFHIDIVPALLRQSGCFIMNKTTNLYEQTDGDGYALWFEAKNKITNKKHLTKVVRLIKYIRDASESFEVKSILLTTLIGNQISTGDSAATYPDLSTSFTEIVSRLDHYLQANPAMPIVTNPSLLTETFTRHWDQEKYSKFRDRIHWYADAAVDAYRESGEKKSFKKWRNVFGDHFPSYVEPAAKSSTTSPQTRDVGEQFLSDFEIPESLKYNMSINARVIQDGYRPFALRGNTDRLRKKRKLEFFIDKIEVPEPFEIKWKVKNIGAEASSNRDLRGEITNDRGFRNKSENTKYEGEHYVECYAIQNGICVAKNRILVPIGSL